MRDRERLIQEDWVGTENGPWRVLVICLCLNLASWPVAELVVKEIFELYPDPIDVDEVTLDPINDSYQTLYEIIRVLGLGKNRMRYLVEMSRQFVRCRALFGDDYRLYRVREFTGCGQYAIDAWRLFVLKERCRPLDRHLIRYAVKEGLVDENI